MHLPATTRMTLTLAVGLLAAAVGGIPVCRAQELVPPDGRYLGQKPPGLTPEVFAPGLVSAPGRRVSKVAFSPDGREAFIRVAFGRTDRRLLHTRQRNGHWSAIQPADFLKAEDADSDYGEPFVSPDGQRLFLVKNADIWVADRGTDGWGKPSPLPAPISTPAEEWHPTVTGDGSLYFCTNRDRPQGGYAIYRARLSDGKYTQVEKIDDTINSQYGAWDPFIARDESYLIFSSKRPDSFGKDDQYVSHRRGGGWSEPRNLGPAVNTSETEYGSYVSPDGKYYFFSRPAPAGGSIFWVDVRAVLGDSDGK